MDNQELHSKLFGSINKDTLKEFKRYHLERPDIYRSFETFAYRMKRTGKRRYSAKAIMERIRWEHDLHHPDTEFKISNSFTSLYVRLLIWNNRDFADFFQLKRVKGLQRHIEKDELQDQDIQLS